MGPDELKATALQLAQELGFACAGVAPARPSAHAGLYMQFLELGCHGQMSYLARDPQRRSDPRSLLQGAASVICLAVPYGPALQDASSGHIAGYARGRDYHRLLKRRCRSLVEALSKHTPLRARICVDTSPLLERDLAASAGLGWIGRNGCLITRRWGSYVLLAEIVTDLALPADSPTANGCGNCQACLQACPTGAIRTDGLVDARLCVSYLTIEHRPAVPERLRGGFGERVFGCDACQEACPHNRRAEAGDAELRGPSELARAPLGSILSWDDADWDRLTRGSAARRARLEMFLRNAAIAAGNAGDGALRPALRRLAAHEAPEVADAARWALRQCS